MPFRRRVEAAARLFVLTLLLVLPSNSRAADTGQEHDRPLIRLLSEEDLRGTSELAGLGVANASCPVGCDTIWVGHNVAGPGGSYLGVGVGPGGGLGAGGRWDFDTAIAGTDSTQGWRRWALPYRTGGSRPASLRLEWAYDYGNNVNNGNQNLWNSRALSGRKHVLTGVAGVWHVDDMVAVKLNPSDGAEPSSIPIAGVRSAWCGLRSNQDTSHQDALTGNYYNGSLQGEEYGDTRRSEYPGYSNLWDQMLYKDFPASPSGGTLSFKYRTDLAVGIDPVPGGSGWFDPDPTTIANFVNNTVDVFQVWVGSPKDGSGVYDVNRRWFSEVLDHTQPMQKVFEATGKNADTPVVVNYAGINAGTIRVVFRVKTNRVDSDEDTDTVAGFNSKDGAALIDDVSVNGGAAEGFETTGQIRARTLIANLAAGGGPWASTGRPPATYGHVENVLASGLIYEDVNGGIGTPTRLCNLVGNVILTGNHDDPNHTYAVESFQAIESPAIDLAVWASAPGTKNSQGIDQEMASSGRVIVNYDWYSGWPTLDESVFHGAGMRYHGDTMRSPVSGLRQWSAILLEEDLVFAALPECHNLSRTLMGFGVPLGQIDSLRIVLTSETQGWRFGGTNLGNSRGGYFDNIRVGFRKNGTLPPVVTPGTESPQGSPPGPGPGIQLKAWNRLQDSFPFNESVVPGPNAEFDTTTALMVSGLNIVMPSTEPGSVAGDSLVARASWTGDGITTGTRMDFVFRIDPGPGSYSVKGNRASSLVNKDPAHPFYAAYMASNGPFGTPGGHGGSWNKDVWNSCRMDSAEYNLYPIVSRGIGNPPKRHMWMGTIHEGDPKFNTLGIPHNVCFLVDPTGVNDETNIVCDGSVPPVYGAVSGTTKEGTKVLPDGWFTPGTHIEYYLRSSLIQDPTVADLAPNPDRVYPRFMSGFVDLDAERHASVDVLPDMWKDVRYGGAGLGCMLLVDAADRRGSNRVYLGAADSAGYGKNNGATSGWKRTGATHGNPNVVSDYVLDNRGQYGLSFDQYDIQGAEAIEGGRLGSRFATNPGAIALKGARTGPSQAMLDVFYHTIIWASGDLNRGTIHDGMSPQQGASDLLLLENFLANSTLADPKGIWLSGSGIVEDGAFYSAALGTFIHDQFGANLMNENYALMTGDTRTTAFVRPQSPLFVNGRNHGIRNSAFRSLDVLEVDPTVPGADVASSYVDPGGNLHTASIFRNFVLGVREYKTLVDGFDLVHVRGSTPESPPLSPLGQIERDNNSGRHNWMRITQNYYGYCLRRGPVVGIGDVPGSDGMLAQDRLIGTTPNPAHAGKEVGISFTLATSRDVTIRFFSPAGRELARRSMAGRVGVNRLAWDGRLSSGARAPAGVYFYRIEGLGPEAHGSRNRVVLLGP